MPLKITDLTIDPKSLGSIMLLADITPVYEYKDGEKTDKLVGYRYSVVLPSHKMEKIGIKVESITPLVDLEKADDIPIGTQVVFKGLVVGSYFSKGNINITAKADSVAFA